jgi:hypothetical protein
LSRPDELSVQLKQCAEIFSSYSFQSLQRGERETATWLDSLRRRTLLIADLAYTCSQQRNASDLSQTSDAWMQLAEQTSQIRELSKNSLDTIAPSISTLEGLTLRMENELRLTLADMVRCRTSRSVGGFASKLRAIFGARNRAIESFLLDTVTKRTWKTNYVPLFVLVNDAKRALGDSIEPSEVRESIEHLVGQRIFAGIRNVGGVDIIEFVPSAIDEDQLAILQLASRSPKLSLADCMMKLNWTQDRVIRALKGLEIAGVASFDSSERSWVFSGLGEGR